MFIFFSSKGQKISSRVYFNDSLNILNLSTEKNRLKKIFTPDILDISSGSCIQVKRENDLLYPITLKTRRKNLLLASKSLSDRDLWYTNSLILLKYAKECFSSVGLRKYVDSAIRNKENEEEIIKLRETQYREWLRVSYFERELQVFEKESIKLLLNDLVSKVELFSHQTVLTELEKKVVNLIGDKFLLKQTQGNLVRSLQQKDQEIQALNESFTSVNKHLQVLNTQHFEGDPWKKILTFLNFSEQLKLCAVSSRLRRLTLAQWGSKKNWKKIARAGLVPRRISWRVYVNKFYDTEIAAMGQEVLPEVIEEIKQDVNRGVPGQFEEVEEILIGVCALFPNVGYCQGMQQVAHFLLGAFRDSNEVLGALLNLLRPPFYLGDLWKTGFTRLKLAIFQLKYLLKLKLPFFARHLKRIEVRLDVIVTPWLLTVFTCLIGKRVSVLIVQSIWDFFLVNGWPALISACLGLFSIFQPYVLGSDLEGTLQVFAAGVDCSSLTKEILKYEVSQAYLDELEKAFCLKEDAYS
jgi:hypothetical protein